MGPLTWNLRDLVRSALILSLCLVFPALFHLFGGGTVLLPLFWPLLMGALFMRPLAAWLTGFLAPIFSAVLMGMPPLCPPVAFLMALEGGLLAGMSALIMPRVNGRWRRIPLAAILLLDRVGVWAALYLLGGIWGLPPRETAWALSLQGLPGLGLLLLVVPAVWNGLERLGWQAAPEREARKGR